MVSQRIGPPLHPLEISGEIYPEMPNSLLGFLSRKTRGYHHQSPSQYEEYIPGWWYTYPSEKHESVGMVIPNIWKNKKMFQTTNQIQQSRRQSGVACFHADPVKSLAKPK